MMFQKTVAVGPAARSQPRKGTFALEPVEALPRISEKIRHLSERSLEPNPFFLPEFLEPAIQGLGRKNLRLAMFSDRDDLHFFAPVIVSGGEVFGGRRFTVWAHPYAPLGTPLIDRETAPQVADSLIAHMRTSRRRLFVIPHLPQNGPTAAVLRGAAERDGFWTLAEKQMRPILHPDKAGGLAEFDHMVSQKRRRELDRQLRRLCEAGAVSFWSARTASEIETAFAMFTTLEASGWKGRRGTALAKSNGVHAFARAAVTQLAQKGEATIDVLRLGDRPLAALIRLDYRRVSIPWKVAFDEEFAAASPGKQLMCDETRHWLSDATVERVDPVCEQDNAMLSLLWTEREPYATLLVSSRSWGMNARLRAGLTDLRNAGKEQAKLLVRGRKRKSKPAAKPSDLNGKDPLAKPEATVQTRRAA